MALIGWWKLDEGTGTLAADSGTGADDGTLTNMTNDDWVTGPNGLPALEFNGTDQFVNIGDVTTYDGLSQISFSAHVNSPDMSQFDAIIAKYNVVGSQRSFLFGLLSGNLIALYSTDGSNETYWLGTTSPFSNDTDHHIAATMDLSTATGLLYVDGSLVASSRTNDATGTLPNVTGELFIAADRTSASPNQLFAGVIADPRIYDHILSAGEISTLAAYTGSSSTQLVIGDINHTHSVDNIALTQAQLLAMASVDHAHPVDSLLLDLATPLIIPDTLHAHSVDQLALTTKSVIAIQDVLHTHLVDSLLLGTQETLVISDSSHTHLVDQPALTVKSIISISDLSHTHSVDAITLDFTAYVLPLPSDVVQYTCTIAAPTFSDLVVPISSFSMTLRQSTNQCYLSVVIPKILDYADDISDRAAGTVTVAQVRNGFSTNLLTANLTTIRTDQGGRNRTGTIVSYKQITFSGTGSFPLAGANYRSSSDGTRRYRTTPHASLKPTDEVVVNGETFNVETVNWTVSSRSQIMEILELLP